HLDLVDSRRIEREDALHAHAVAHLPHRERGVHVPALAADDDSLENLDSLLVAFADLRMHAQGVADAEFRHLAADFRRDVALLHQLDRLRTHLRTLSDYRSPKNNLPSSLLPGEQVGAALACARHRLLAPPLRDLRVVAGEEHVRNAQTAEVGRPRILRPLEKPVAGKALRLCGKLVAQHTRHETRNGVDHSQRSELAAREDEIAE